VDSFEFDVSNGISSLERLVFRLTILPRTIYIETRPIAVTEGRSTPMTAKNLHVITGYYADKIADYLIVDPPTHGWLVAAGDRAKRKENMENVAIFSISDLERNLIEYVHDGSDTAEDAFSLVGRTDSKTSVPAVVHVQIVPVNDETPRVINNTGVEVWAGAVGSVISDSMLGAEDPDSPPERLMFRVEGGPDCGFLSLRARPDVPVDRFSQEDLLSDRVLFTHTGKGNDARAVSAGTKVNNFRKPGGQE